QCSSRGASERREPARIKPGRSDRRLLRKLVEHQAALARTFQQGNSRSTEQMLVDAATQAIERLLCMQFLDERHADSERLVARFARSATAWQDFMAASRRLERIYDGKLLARHAVLDDPAFRADEETFAGICADLAGQKSPYDFAAMPIQVLGSLY